MALFKKVDCVMLRVEHLDAAVEFYSEGLGHELLWRSPTAVGLRMPETDAELVLSTVNGPETDLLVDDTRNAFLMLIERGATALAEPFEVQIGLCAVVRDPWGNVLTILDSSKGLLKVDDKKRVISGS